MNPTLRCNLRVLRTHNNEARYHEERGRIAASPAQVRAYDWIEARRYRRYSARLMEQCDAVWWVSFADEMAEASTNLELARKSGWLPHFHDVAQRHPFVQRRDCRVLFVGALRLLAKHRGDRLVSDLCPPKTQRNSRLSVRCSGRNGRSAAFTEFSRVSKKMHSVSY